jgi:hypothetical protein
MQESQRGGEMFKVRIYDRDPQTQAWVVTGERRFASEAEALDCEARYPVGHVTVEEVNGADA